MTDFSDRPRADRIGSLLQALVWQGTVAKILLPEDSIDVAGACLARDSCENFVARGLDRLVKSSVARSRFMRILRPKR
ncbi:MAG: hypothetical protein GDA48_10555 [Hormoscilla sp. GM102CHS1]|nr:hypothetical protein [Hormoscilla sp. GM102CHS1]